MSPCVHELLDCVVFSVHPCDTHSVLVRELPVALQSPLCAEEEELHEDQGRGHDHRTDNDSVSDCYHIGRHEKDGPGGTVIGAVLALMGPSIGMFD